MYDQLYRHQEALTDSDLSAYAAAIGLDARPVRTAIEMQTYRERIERDVTSGERSAIEGTPALFVNGFAYDDAVTVEALGETIERALTA
jgi:protein-disulfide isomerase